MPDLFTNLDYSVLGLLGGFAFLAGFIDSVVGGGGLVQIPALFVLFPQFTVPQVIGTNRFSSFMGTGVAAAQYAQRVRIPWLAVGWAALGAAVCSYLGATVSSLISAAVLRPLMLVLMTLIALYTYRAKNLGHTEALRMPLERLPVYSLLIGMAIGFYNGFVGPGTGSLLVFAFVSLVGFDFLRSSATAKVVNVVADISSLIFFLWHGHVAFQLALPMMACNMAGSFLGSRMAILRGSAFIRIVFLVVVFGLIGRFAWDVFLVKS